MKQEQLGERLFVRLDRGEEVVGTLTNLCKEMNIGCAALTGIGAVKDIELGYYDLSLYTYLNKKIPDICELVSLTGNVALVEGEPFVHAHACVARRDLRMLGGHLVRATVAVTVEAFLLVGQTPLIRELDPEVKLKLVR